MKKVKFPATRFQGSKRKILEEISSIPEIKNAQSIIDLYSGSGIVSLLFRYLGKRTLANDYQLYNQNTASVFLNVDAGFLGGLDVDADLDYLLCNVDSSYRYVVSDNYCSIYFKDEENRQIDLFCQNIKKFDGLKKAVYIYAVGQALIKKRPYNLFHRANLGMRLKDVERSFGNHVTWGTPIKDHAIKCIKELSSFPFDKDWLGGEAICVNTLDLSLVNTDFDVVYMDPPYINGKSVSVDYSDFYNFLEGLCDYDLFGAGDNSYPHKPIAKKESAWAKEFSALDEVERVCSHFKRSSIVMSYRSDGCPTPSRILDLMRSCGRESSVHSAGEYQYALSKNKSSEEIFIIASPSF